MIKALSVALVLLGLSQTTVMGQEERIGVDRTFPIHHKEWSPINPERKRIYEEFMQGCRDAYGRKGDRCDQTEQDRIDMSLRQPQSP